MPDEKKRAFSQRLRASALKEGLGFKGLGFGVFRVQGVNSLTGTLRVRRALEFAGTNRYVSRLEGLPTNLAINVVLMLAKDTGIQAHNFENR